ncbi:MAG: hypothetical protein AABZ06_06365 [Bdellovibrionota bacterium]
MYGRLIFNPYFFLKYFPAAGTICFTQMIRVLVFFYLLSATASFAGRSIISPPETWTGPFYVSPDSSPCVSRVISIGITNLDSKNEARDITIKLNVLKASMKKNATTDVAATEGSIKVRRFDPLNYYTPLPQYQPQNPSTYPFTIAATGLTIPAGGSTIEAFAIDFHTYAAFPPTNWIAVLTQISIEINIASDRGALQSIADIFPLQWGGCTYRTDQAELHQWRMMTGRVKLELNGGRPF